MTEDERLRELRAILEQITPRGRRILERLLRRLRVSYRPRRR